MESSFAANTAGMQPIIHGHLDNDDFFQSTMVDLSPPNLEQLAAMGAQHEPQLAMELFAGTPLFDNPYHNPMPQHVLMGMQMPAHVMDQSHMLQRDGSTPLESSSLDHSVGMAPPIYSMGSTQEFNAPAPVKSNRGRKPLPRTTEERMLATQEKNRRAQRKFRCVSVGGVSLSGIVSGF